MAVSPTRAQAADMVGDAIRLLDGALVGVGGVPANLQTLVGNLISDFPARHTSTAEAFRARLASALVAQARDTLNEPLINFVRTQVNSPETDIQIVLDRMYQDLIDNAETIESRGITYGPAVPDGGNNGTGVIYRLTEDSEAYDLEATHLDVKTVRCTADQTTGAVKHQEQFIIEGQRAGIDAIEILGSGSQRQDVNTRSRTSRDSVLANCGFESFNLGSATFTAGVAALQSDSTVTGWELLNAAGAASDPTLYELDQNVSLQARDLSGVANPTSIRMRAVAGGHMLRQLLSVNGVVLADANPYGIVLHVYRESLADGTLTVRWGSQSQAITVTTLTDSAWNKVPITFDQLLWPAQFNTADPGFEIEWSGRTVGSLVFDELEALVPMVGFDGLWFHISGGVGLTQTLPAAPEVAGKWLLDDEVTFSDSLTATDSQLQQWLFRLYGRHLPHSGTPSANWTEPF